MVLLEPLEALVRNNHLLTPIVKRRLAHFTSRGRRARGYGVAAVRRGKDAVLLRPRQHRMAQVNEFR